MVAKRLVPVDLQLSDPWSGWVRVPRPPGTLPSHLETFERSVIKCGISREAATTVWAAHRLSMRGMWYSDTWWPFCRWWSGWKKDPFHPSIKVALSHRQHLWQLDLKHATIISHLCALRSHMNKVDGVPVGRHHLVLIRCLVTDRKPHLEDLWFLGISGSGSSH